MNYAQQFSSNAGYNRILIEIVVPGVTGGQKSTVFPIPQQQQLLNAKVYKIEVFTNEDFPKTPTGRDVATGGQIQSAFLNLYMNDMSPQSNRGQGLYIQNQPLITLHTIQNNNSDPFEFWPFDLVGQVVIWDNQSTINLATAPNNTTDFSFLLAVDYLFTPASQ